jgi:SAM-dependent methyltransferase
MSDLLPAGAETAPAAVRNRGPILEVLKSRLPTSGAVLEIAAGTGEHAVYYAAAFPGLRWQPTDPDPDALRSIEAWRQHAALPNLSPARQLDAADPAAWLVEPADVVININMIHITPWAVTQGLLAGAGRILRSGGILFLYGPYIEPDVETVPSNLAFDRSLRSRDPEWGIRRLDDVTRLAAEHGLKLSERIAMPANNLALFIRKT